MTFSSSPPRMKIASVATVSALGEPWVFHLSQAHASRKQRGRRGYQSWHLRRKVPHHLILVPHCGRRWHRLPDHSRRFGIVGVLSASAVDSGNFLSVRGDTKPDQPQRLQRVNLDYLEFL